MLRTVGKISVIKVSSRYFAIGTHLGLVLLYDRKQQSRTAVLGSRYLDDHRVPVSVTSIAFTDRISEESDSTRLMVVGYSSGNIIVWSLTTFVPVKTVANAFTKSVRGISPDRTSFLSHDDGIIKLFQVYTMMGSIYVDPQVVPINQIVSDLGLNDSEDSGSFMYWLTGRPTKAPEVSTISNITDVQILSKSERYIISGFKDDFDMAELVAVTTPTQVIISTLKPTPKTLRVITEKTPPCIAWRCAELPDGDYEQVPDSETRPMLSVAFGNRLQFYEPNSFDS